MEHGLRQMRDDARELDRVDELLTLAYGTASRRREIELYLAVQPDGWFVIEEAGRLVAVAGCIAYGSFCWLGLVATHPEAQGRGLATRISRRLVAWSAEHGCRTIALDASDVGRPVYERLGFQADGWTLDLQRPASAPAAVGARADALAPGDLETILELDPTSFGGDRGRLLRSLIAGRGEPCFVTREGGRVTGYLIVRERLIGPGIAPDRESAERLLRSASDVAGERHLLVPRESAYVASLVELGFVEWRRLAHMRLGELELPGAREQLIAELSFAAG